MDDKTAKLPTKSANGTAKLAPPSPRNGNRLPLGNHPGNTGGKPGRSGRPSNAFREACAKAAEEAVLPKVARVVQEQEPDTATGKPNPTWWQAAETVLRYGHSEAPREVNAKVEGALVLKAVRE